MTHKDNHTKRVLVSFEAWCDPRATHADIAEFIHELEWSGGCRHPDNDPLFDSITVKNLVVRRSNGKGG